MSLDIQLIEESNHRILRIRDHQQLDWSWQVTDNKKTIYFEAIAEGVSGKNVIQDCTIMWDGIHLTVKTGDILSYYFQEMNLAIYTTLTKHLKHIYQAYPNLIEVLD